MNSLAIKNTTEQPFWFAMATANRQDKAPYSYDVKVTPLSVYRDMEWLFPISWLTAGHHKRDKLRFANWSMRDDVDQLKAGCDDRLIDQLKQYMYCLIFHRNQLIGSKKTLNARPRTLDSEFLIMRQFFVALKKVGLNCLSQLTQKNSVEALSALEITPPRFNLMIDYVVGLIRLSAIGLIEGGLRPRAFAFKKKLISQDTSKHRGVQPLSPDEIAEVISTSLFYMENGNELLEMARTYLATPLNDRKNLVARFSIKYPIFASTHSRNFLKTAWKLLQISAFHLTGFHLGMRISEFLSQKVGCVGIHDDKRVMFNDRVTLHMTTVKAAETLYGHSRYFPVHPYMQYIHMIISNFRDILEIKGDLLFTALNSSGMWNTSNFNLQLKKFNKSHGIAVPLSTHVWRKTIVATTVLSVRDPLEALRELLGHQGVAEAASYAMSSPFVKDEIERENAKLVQTYLDELVADSAAFGGPGLGGPQGVQLEVSLKQRGVPALGTRKKRQERRKVVDQSLVLGMTPTPVANGIECLKQPNARGDCAQGSGDSLPNIAGCRSGCRYRIERAERGKLLEQKIKTAPDWLENVATPMMDRIRQASEMMDNLSGWPDLRPCFELMLTSNPHLKRFF